MSLIPEFRDRWSTKPPSGVNLDQGFPYGNCSLAAPVNEVGGTRTINWANNVRRCPIGTLRGTTVWTKGKYGPSITVSGGNSNSVDFGNTGIAAPGGALTNLGVTMFLGCRVTGAVVNASTLVGNSQTGAFGNYVQLFTSNPNMRFVYGAFNSNGTLNSTQDLTGDNLWCFTSGVGRNMEVWRNGIITASQATNGIVPSADNYSVNFLLGGDNNQSASPVEYHFCYVWRYQLSQAAILTLFKNPWIIWMPPDQPGRQVPLAVFIPAAPTCTLSASPTSIPSGSSSTLTWTTANTPTTATIDNGVGSVSTTGGTVSVSPTVTTTYHLTVSNLGGTSTCQATVTVTSPVPHVAPSPNQPVAGICAPHIDCLITLYKDPIDSKQYMFDWSSWMPPLDAIADSKWACFPPGVTIVSSSFTGTTTTVTLGGGIDGTVYILRNAIATSTRVEVRSARLFVNIAHATPPAALQ